MVDRRALRLGPWRSYLLTGLRAAPLVGLALMLIIFSAPTFAGDVSPESLLGNGRGVDHVGVVVRDLDQAQRDFERLGFKVSGRGSFPGGLSNRGITFGNGTYLELLSVADPQHASSNVSGFVDFAKKHEGAMFLGLNVSSAKDAADYLRARNFDVDGPVPGSFMTGNETKPPPPQWYSVQTADKPAPNKLAFTLPIFFIEYLKDNSQDRAHIEASQHANAAVAIHTVWLAVHDELAQLETLRKGGFSSVPGGVRILGERGTEIGAGAGSMVLLHAEDKNSPVQQFLGNHDDDIIALSVEVADLAKARGLAQAAAHGDLPIYDGAYGKSILLPPDLTHGVWIELFER